MFFFFIVPDKIAGYIQLLAFTQIITFLIIASPIKTVNKG